MNLLDWSMAGQHLFLLATAYILALPIAWDREKSERTAGLRTFPLVAIASCGFMLIGIEMLDSTEAEAKVVQGLITGIGFIGGGAILKQGDGIVQGTATAASLWATGAIGLAVAASLIEIALIISIATFLTLRFLKPVARELEQDEHK